MFKSPKSLSLCIPRLVIRQHFLQFCEKYSHVYKNKREDEENDKFKKKKEDQEDYLQLYKSRGQHLLTNQRVLDSIVQKSHVKPTDTVLEIGPGTGNLTLKLLEVAKHVIAVEIDKRMIEILNKRVAESGLEHKITVINKDALKTEFSGFDLVVANIPYNISSPLLAKLLFGVSTFRSATLLLQKEFARRLLANPGDSDYNRLAVNVKLVADVKFVMDVSKRDFVPCPKVDSSVVKIYPKDDVPYKDLDEWGAFTKTCFTKKNKTLGATFKQKKKVMELYKLFNGRESNEEKCGDGNCRNVEDEEVSDEEDCDELSGLDTGVSNFKDKIMAVLKSGGFEDKRPSKLPNTELLKLLLVFNQAGIYFYDQARPTDVEFLTN
ncbi:rRNA adenine N(6)-methyltransferase [Heracleum sosnowskyi]|uniref:rRNA adenine N(6)-methyltransferase n=1 Tax=Heracleum sosnowskyi TaxID=360622 RepID=A0AAD8H132_9APIA|nr:rRNA adenine N(6)-methyltransferase [Heracleum sosnowskyi]